MDDYSAVLALKILDQINFHPQNESEVKLAKMGLSQKLLNAEGTALMNSLAQNVKDSSEENNCDVVSSGPFPFSMRDNQSSNDVVALSNEVCIIFQRRLLSMKRALAQTISDCSNEKCSPEPDTVLDTGRVSTIIAEFLQDAKKTDDTYVQMFEQLRQMRDEYVKELKECAEKAKYIEEVLSKEEIGEMQNAIDNCRLKAQALALKLRLAKLVLMAKIYTPEEMERVQQTQQLQKQKEEQLLVRKWKAERTLEAYRSVDGKEFQALVKEYAELQSRIQHQRWILDEMIRLKHDD